MILEELRHEAEACQSRKYGAVQLVLIKNSPPSNQVRLAGRYGPTSTEIANVQKRDDGRYDVVAWFDPEAILRFCDRAEEAE